MKPSLSVLTAPIDDDDEADAETTDEYGDDDARAEIGSRIAGALGIRGEVDGSALASAIEDLLDLRG